LQGREIVRISCLVRSRNLLFLHIGGKVSWETILHGLILLNVDAMLKELEGLVGGEGFLVLRLSSGLCTVGIEQLSVVDVGIFLLKLTNFVIQSLLLLRGALDVVLWLARGIFNDLAGELSELF
jgi:hypothetical protein